MGDPGTWATGERDAHARAEDGEGDEGDADGKQAEVRQHNMTGKREVFRRWEKSGDGLF